MLSTQYHCREIIKQTIAYLNAHQTPEDLCDQPVFALTKEIQWRYPEKFSSSSCFCLFGGLHCEQCMVTIHGELIKGSSLKNILSNIDMSVIWAGTLFHANHIKQVHYCPQVSLCIVFKIKRCERQIRFDVKFFKMVWTIEKSKWNVLLLVFNWNTFSQDFYENQTFDSCHGKFNEVGIFFWLLQLCAMDNSTSIWFDDSLVNLSPCFCPISEGKIFFSKNE